jgi:urea transporter
MILKPRKTDRRHFRSPIREARTREREYYYAAVSILVVKIILLVFLCILLYVTIQVFTGMYPDGSALKRFGLPILIAAFILVLLRFIINNIKELREARKKPREQPPV